MGPDGIGGSTIALGIAGIIDIDKVDLAIVVVVIGAEIDPQRVVGKGAGLDHHILRTDIEVVDATIGTIVGHVVLQFDRAHDIEGGLELAIRLGDVVVATRTRGTIIVVALLIHLAREEGLVVFWLEAVVGKLDQQHQSANLAL